MNFRKLRAPAVDVHSLLSLACIAFVAGCSSKEKPAEVVAVPVIASEVIVRDQPVYLESMAQALGSQDVEIRARVEGILEGVHFHEGSFVNEGDLLYTIDPKTLQAKLDEARGGLAQAKAALEKADRDVARLTPLWEQHAISRQMLDDALAAQRSATASVAVAAASLENTEIQLGYTEIRAPISGLIGKTEVKAGNLVGRGSSTLLTTISSVDPIHFRFSVSEGDYLRWRRAYSDEENARAATEGMFELILADGTLLPSRGSVVFADRNVDPTTGTLLLEVSFPNEDNLVRPGQFGRVRVPVRRIENAVLVPQRAVQELQATYSVYVVTKDNKAEFRKVKRGPRVGDLYVIEEGLKPGEVVVIEGVQKLRNNVPVAPTIEPSEAASDATES